MITLHMQCILHFVCVTLFSMCCNCVIIYNISFSPVQSVTSFGRQMIEHSRMLVEEKYSTDNGYAHNAKV